jgi:hypothetical protein
MALQDFVEEIQVLGRDLVNRVRSLIHEGNVQPTAEHTSSSPKTDCADAAKLKPT